MIRTLTWLTLFSIAMGYLETAVVVYLRAIYYPAGFDFPLVNMSPAIAITELGRELATIIMLAGIGIVAGKNPTQRFAWFLYCFAIWDIFYYVFLKVLLDWPASFLTWDILFLIPFPWVGPVIAPVVISLTMILLTLLLVRFNERNEALRLNSREWLLLVSGSLVVVFSFMLDCCRFMYSYQPLPVLAGKKREATERIMDAISHYAPVAFDWWIFWVGELMIIAAIVLFYLRGIVKKS